MTQVIFSTDSAIYICGMKVHESVELIRKYNVPGPRYTSYPTVPFWKSERFVEDLWEETIRINQGFFRSNQVSLYVHLPFCESLCTFCGCHKRITRNHAVERPYIDTVLKEWNLYKELLGKNPVIKELHFGGGTPTFFDVKELVRLVNGLFEGSEVNADERELSFEAHPNNTSEAHLKELFALGFRRLSLGIQDYSPVVQKAIHRIQSYEQVKKVHNLAREIGYTSISHDLVFGLPKQKLDDIVDTVEKTLKLMPDRISLYSYAHVPWIKGNGQRGYDENDLPKDGEKRALYEKAKSMLEDAGYLEIGMDHFALPEDDLAKAFLSKSMHRNFMGYTTQATSLLIGLGMSSISDSWFGFAQNEKTVELYSERVEKGEIPIFRGHILGALDLEIRQYILDLMCHFETTLESDSPFQKEQGQILQRLQEMVKDGLVKIEGKKVSITRKGIPFVRNCCMAFDQSLANAPNPVRLFSKTI